MKKGQKKPEFLEVASGELLDRVMRQCIGANFNFTQPMKSKEAAIHEVRKALGTDQPLEEAYWCKRGSEFLAAGLRYFTEAEMNEMIQKHTGTAIVTPEMTRDEAMKKINSLKVKGQKWITRTKSNTYKVFTLIDN